MLPSSTASANFFNTQESTTMTDIYPDEFWQWVASRKQTDNPRGDFIGDLRVILEMGKDPNDKLSGACKEAVIV